MPTRALAIAGLGPPSSVNDRIAIALPRHPHDALAKDHSAWESISVGDPARVAAPRVDDTPDASQSIGSLLGVLVALRWLSRGGTVGIGCRHLSDGWSMTDRPALASYSNMIFMTTRQQVDRLHRSL
jgi:hypothetical protein